MSEARSARLAMRRGEWEGMTVHRVPGFVQCNVVILPADEADEFRAYCDANPRPCPLIEMTEPGNPEPKASAPGADLRTDLARYAIFRGGAWERDVDEIKALWRDDSVGFLLGSSLSFDYLLEKEGIVRSPEVWVLRTRMETQAAGKYGGPLVVTMRWLPSESAGRARDLTARYPKLHGAPVHIGDPEAIGADLARPMSGRPVESIPDGVIPVFWACGVTPQVAGERAKPPLMITHASGYGFITDLTPEMLIGD